MRKLVLVLAAIFFTQTVWADKMSGEMQNKACGKIAKACLKAGYKGKAEMNFWENCMMPVLMNKEVKGMTIDADTAKECRVFKIQKMTNELKDLESVS